MTEITLIVIIFKKSNNFNTNLQTIPHTLTIISTNLNANLSNLYIKSDLPNLELGDTVKVTIYLELPKEVAEGEKKEKERIQSFEGVDELLLDLKT